MNPLSAFPMHTQRLILRPFEEGDIEAFAAYRSDPEIARYQGWDAPYTRERAAAFVREMMTVVPGQPGVWMQIALSRRDAPGLIGDCAFCVLQEDPRQAEIGFSLARAWQGQGYMTEAVLRLLDYLFTDLKLHRVRANCDPQNEASARVLRRVGLRHEGRFIDSLWLKGGYVSEDWYAILRSEWRP